MPLPPFRFSQTALEDTAALDKGIARRLKQAVERFADTGVGNVKRLQGIDPPEYRLRVGDYRVPSIWTTRPSTFFASAIAARPTAEGGPARSGERFVSKNWDLRILSRVSPSRVSSGVSSGFPKKVTPFENSV
jgi:mRNA-degrading endonuclease RelE of RelBE toxin-antitoxin system